MGQASLLTRATCCVNLGFGMSVSPRSLSFVVLPSTAHPILCSSSMFPCPMCI